MIVILLILLGKTTSGKDTVVKKLVDEHNFNRILDYTTRPIRKGEVDGVNYKYISDEEFQDMIDKGVIDNYREYETTTGVWKYGFSRKDITPAYEEGDYVIILPPDRYEKFINDYPDLDYTSVYLYANDSTMYKRLVRRNDKNDDIRRRIDSDRQDFKNLEMKVNKIVYNNWDTDVDSVVIKIVDYYNANKY